ncbi:MAG: hypothetical protein K0R65_1489 [Crocinitomicaceae bacterium]|jgi:uncharacterized membrane protein|nr:hypothetical protein [Crocinitomicaceae bacterium]
MNAKDFFTEAQQQEVIAAISAAELNTSGEIRLHLVDSCAGDPKEEAIAVFEKLGMTATELRNGVLIFLAVQDKKFAIIGDKGINEAVPADFWDSIRDEILSNFKQGDYLRGLRQGISHVGEKLKAHFPFSDEDKNELSNDISFE